LIPGAKREESFSVGKKAASRRHRRQYRIIEWPYLTNWSDLYRDIPLYNLTYAVHTFLIPSTIPTQLANALTIGTKRRNIPTSLT